MRVFDLSPHRSIIEVPDHLTPPGLAIELDVIVFEREDGTAFATAGWFTEGGTWLGDVEVGEA